ncbi:hypothetical protein IFM89_006659 [Coptis chinensis]|uniref:Uncharacterized protein n=1 Tax=Coptis chinensis TaxID=261450 RepID=A0A835MBW0_9MAGN|nr:hypothetical protein IFM89_006659 [Coptis chinensis]
MRQAGTYSGILSGGISEELTVRSWMVTLKGKRRTLHKEDVAAAIISTDIFDFLVSLVSSSNGCETANLVNREEMVVEGI